MAALTLGISLLGSCGVYKKFEMPQDESSVVSDYVEAQKVEVDSAAFGNLCWQEVFTDPVLVDLINKALENNVNLQNAKLNVDIA